MRHLPIVAKLVTIVKPFTTFGPHVAVLECLALCTAFAVSRTFTSTSAALFTPKNEADLPFPAKLFCRMGAYFTLNVAANYKKLNIA